MGKIKNNVSDVGLVGQKVGLKLHMLEEHVAGFIKKWGNGKMVLAFIYNEQGGESIHSEFNNIHMFYRMKPNTRRLKCMMNEHHMRVHPMVKVLEPKIKARKRIKLLTEE